MFYQIKDIAPDSWILNDYQQTNWDNKWWYIIKILSTPRTHNAVQQSGRIPFIILFAQFFDKFNKPRVQWRSRHIGYISVQALHLRLASEGAIATLSFPPFSHQEKPKNNECFVTARIDFGVAFRFNFLGIFILPKSSVAGRNVVFG